MKINWLSIIALIITISLMSTLFTHVFDITDILTHGLLGFSIGAVWGFIFPVFT